MATADSRRSDRTNGVEVSVIFGAGVNAIPERRNSRPQGGRKMARKKFEADDYEIVGFCWSFLHPKTGKRVVSRNGRPFPIKRRKK
jgi:hypothetical protein